MSHPYVVVIDIDNCIADDCDRRHLIKHDSDDVDFRYHAYHDACDMDPVINKHIVDYHFENGHQLAFVTARPEEFRLKTWQWIRRNFPCGEDTLLIMRPPNNHEPSHVLKPWLLLKHLRVEDIVVAYDDNKFVIAAYRGIGVRDCVLVSAQPQAKKGVPDIMREMAETFEERNKVYGAAYKRHGAVMMGLFPDGITLNTPDDFTRYGVLVMIVSKLNRYASNLAKGGHQDSAHDMAVYSAMLEELTK